MKKKDEIMSSKELRDIFVAYVAQNRVLLESALDKYDDAWYDIRNQMAENGMELTPEELQDTTELIRDCLRLLDGESK
jgi:chloramphenicol 3-O-phosphotransferase